MSRYYILTSAPDDKNLSRTFNQFDTREELVECIIENYETDPINQNKRDADGELEYSSNDLFEFIDKTFGELVCLEKQEGTDDLYIPYTADWVKQQLYEVLRITYEKDCSNAMNSFME